MSDEASLVFSRHEFERRVELVQQGMRRASQDAMLLTTAADIFYITGFLTRFWESPARPWFVIIPLKGGPVAVIPEIGHSLMLRTWVDHIRIWPAPDPDDDGVSLLADTLNEFVPLDGLIGIPMGLETHLRMPLGSYRAVCEGIGDRQFVDGTQIIQRVREVKSDAEIAKIQSVCAVADRVFSFPQRFLALGKPLDGVFRDFQMALLEEGADWVSYVAGAAGPGGYGDVISPASDEPLEKGDVVMLDTGAVREGYFCDFDRNYAIGKASDEVKKGYAVLLDVTDELMRELRPGMGASEAHAILYRGLERRGANPLDGRMGHGLGIALTEWPSFSAKDETILRENMVLTIEPGIELAPGRIMVHEENIVLRADGAELLSARASSEIIEII